MTIVVSGKIYVKPGQRDKFIERSLSTISAARQTAGCLDFAVSPDPIEADRVNIFEEWRSREELFAFRRGGPSDDIACFVETFHVNEHEVGHTTNDRMCADADTLGQGRG